MPEEEVKCYDFGEFRLDVANNQLLKDDAPVSITQRSFEILRLLVENRGLIVKKDELLDALWEEDFVEEATLTQHIYMLRKVLKKGAIKRNFIETVPKKGYRFIVDVFEIKNPELQKQSISENFVNKTTYRENAILTSKAFFSTSLINSADSGNKTINPKIKLSRKSKSAFLAFAIFLIGIFGYFYFTSEDKTPKEFSSKINSIAVLPFQQIGDEKDEKLGLGTSDILISKLGKFEGFRVLPTTSIIRYSANDNVDLSLIGKKLGVDAILSGTIQRNKNLVRVTVQLYSVQNENILWAEKFDESYSGIFSLQDNISEQVANRLSLKLKDKNISPTYTEYTKNQEAYQAYSMGLYYWGKHDAHGFHEAIMHFERAIEKDPNFSLAYALLADSYAHTGHIADLIAPDKARERAIQLAEKALEIDPNNAEAMASLALVYVSTNHQSKAFELLKKSIEINPNYANARQRLSRLYANQGELDKAVSEMNYAHILDPESNYISLSLAELLNMARRPDEAIHYTKKVLEEEPNSDSAKWRLAESYEQKKMYTEAASELEQILKRHKQAPSVELAISRIYAKNNKTDEARKIVDRIVMEGKAEHSKNLVSYTFASLGDSKEAIKWLKKSKMPEDVEASYILKFEPNLDTLRDKPEFKKMLAKLDAKRQT